MNFKTREEFDKDCPNGINDLGAVEKRLESVLEIAKTSLHGSMFSRTGFKWMLPEVIYYCQDLIKRIKSRPTCSPEQRKFLDELEKMDSIEIGYMDFDGFDCDMEKVIRGE